MIHYSVPNVVDLRSDTVTQPTPAMRDVMAGARVGDDVFGDDPTVNELQRTAAALLGKEAALFVPSGTMGNLLAIVSQTRPGDTVILAEGAHPYIHESGGIGMVAGVMPRPIDVPSGILSAKAIQPFIVLIQDPHFSHTTLISIENTMNRGGGAIYPIENVLEIGTLAREFGIRVHCDGARLFNAVVETGVSAVEYVKHVNTVSFCLSKGLGCPVGSILAGGAETIERAYRYRKMLGGGMRQAGVLAAAGLYALENNVARLKEDHARAKRFRAALEGTPGLGFSMPSPTNMVYVDVKDGFAFAMRLGERGVHVLPESPTMVRAVFHLHITDDDVDCAVEAFRACAQQPVRA
jgi:threonine aldolase